ncbi:SH3 domain-containing protein [Subsaxibacter sp. CAU 1640]|uniref:SH3 domain-containing protein n=1 Tax=Subsaxibacter sp. CAU 1640 TaxID=2933271 RepID=UPI002006CDB3|nr:SH3 domain-containing protein [Subsaxibacter sp. CAU 1640]MCK7590571.1 SH3 domain-containing protein [Subsaxibacter sp. CAU 1640]
MKTLKNSIAIILLLFACNAGAQNQEVQFDIYTTSAAKASRYLLADDVALRDCPSAQCEQLTTLKIGTYVRLLAKSETPQTINDVCSRWYKVKMGPQVGWIWGGLIAQTALTSTTDPEVKFFFGEAGNTIGSQTQYQIRAVKGGEELDRIVFTSSTVMPNAVSLAYDEVMYPTQDLIEISPAYTDNLMIVFENGSLSLLENETVSLTKAADAYFADLTED